MVTRIPQDTTCTSHSLKRGPWFRCEDLFTLEGFTVWTLIQTQSTSLWQARCASATICNGGHTHFGPCTLHWDKSAVHAYVHVYTAVMWTTQGELQYCNTSTQVQPVSMFLSNCASQFSCKQVAMNESPPDVKCTSCDTRGGRTSSTMHVK